MTRSLPRMALPHLSDEAVAAFADGVLRSAAQQRARQHLAECHDCAEAVRGQRAASAVLRAAAAPTLPLGLLDRLRQLPGSAALPPSMLAPTGLSHDGQPMFASFGTRTGATRPAGTAPPAGIARPAGIAPLAGIAPPAGIARPAGIAPPAVPVSLAVPVAVPATFEAHRRRAMPGAGLTAAAALAVGVLAATAATAGGSPPSRVPTAPVRGGVAPAGSGVGSPILIGPALDLAGPR